MLLIQLYAVDMISEAWCLLPPKNLDFGVGIGSAILKYKVLLM